MEIFSAVPKTPMMLAVRPISALFNLPQENCFPNGANEGVQIASGQ
jgi:hypothetical protein